MESRSRFAFFALVVSLVGVASGANLNLGVRDYSQEPGYRLLIERHYIPPLMDQEVFDNLWRVWEEPLRAKAESASAEQRRQMALRRYGLTEAPGRPGGVPMQFAASHETAGWAVNCLFCHGGKVAGQVIPGLPNSHIAMQTLYDEVAQTKHLLGQQVPTLPKQLDVPLGDSNGTTNAIVFGVLLGSLRDRDLNYRPNQMVPKLLHNDHDAPAWWYVHKKTHLYSDGHSPKDHRALMAFMMDPANGRDAFDKAEDDYRVILAWMESLETPRWPWSIDATLAAEGETIFNNRCAECHGTYGKDSEYPNQIIPIDVVGTDRTRLDSILPIMRFGAQMTWFGNYGKKKMIVDPGGYLAPPLDGVWASAPYLHNGSVPTLRHLFYPEERPVVWQRSEDGYDQEKIGLEVTAYDDIPTDVTNPRARRTYFDSRIVGKSNAGHIFPAELEEAEKQAVLEYLKTL
ncbi:MAG: cytochrome c [Pirellulales bacterium]|nr:cytochrome c [Pirellulales bacterium]